MSQNVRHGQRLSSKSEVTLRRFETNLHIAVKRIRERHPQLRKAALTPDQASAMHQTFSMLLGAFDQISVVLADLTRELARRELDGSALQKAASRLGGELCMIDLWRIDAKNGIRRLWKMADELPPASGRTAQSQGETGSGRRKRSTH